MNAPWAPPGRYTVRLTANGRSYSQPLTLKLDPRVKTPAAGLAQLATLTRRMYDGAVRTHAAYEQARALVSALDKLQGTDVDAFKKEVEALAPAPRAGGRGRGFGGFGFGRGGAPAGPPSLESTQAALMSAAMAMQAADATPTADQVSACTSAAAQSSAVMARWTRLKTAGLAAFNAKRKAAGLSTVTLPAR